MKDKLSKIGLSEKQIEKSLNASFDMSLQNESFN